MKVFISGPMKGYPNFNKEAFDQAEKELIQQGYTVFNGWIFLENGPNRTNGRLMRPS